MCGWRGLSVVTILAGSVWLGRAAEPSRDDTLIKRGEYLVTQVAGCTHCHTPTQEKGRPDAGRQLQGATLPIRPKEPTKDWADKSTDITRSGLAGKWSEADMVKFLTTAKNPDGADPIPPMPAFHLHDEDARAIAAYLRSLPGSKSK
jgi:mono/diheme cytochrome c family protein